ncbi:Rieske (2Fe-2S) protein [Paraburkholderia fungorum]|uniref:Rieske (2Fe-2S) protein n=1 Tax=Paraburkholderia fungorum TaxID=134537 RepID=UPI001C0DB883|nr:Rieske (2Fe-2S) protein [Paraburkholderia fungorum]
MFLTHLDALSEPGARGFDPHGAGHDTIFVVRRAGAVYGWRDACPHYGDTPMAWRKDAYLNARGTRVVCHAHGAQFEMDSGACVLGPCLGQTLTPVRIRVSQNGEIFLLEPEDDHNKSSAA